MSCDKRSIVVNQANAQSHTRRRFLNLAASSLAATATACSSMGIACNAEKAASTLAAIPKSKKVLNAYYFRAHMYTCVPRHIRHDMETLASWGTTHVTIAVLEQDLRAAHHNIDLVCNEAAKAGLKVLAVPSRWCGLFAGAPKVPSEFAAEYPDTWMQSASGKPVISGPSGPVCSVFHPQVKDYLLKSVETLFSRFDIVGMVMDEPKKLHKKDYSEYARARFGDDPDYKAQLAAKVEVFNEMGKLMKAQRADASLSLFVHASKVPKYADVLASMPQLDYFGCDGRPWPVNQITERNWNRKCLLPDNLDTFKDIATRNGKKTLCLAENYDLPMRYLANYDQGFPAVLQRDLDHLVYYYFPRNIEDPDTHMNVVQKHVKTFALQSQPGVKSGV